MKVVFMLLLLIPLSSLGQVNLTATGLKEGDFTSHYSNNEVFNWKDDFLDMNLFNGKVIILDFWASWCSPCIAGLPKLDSIQREMKSVIQIVPITYQEKAAVEKIITNLFESKSSSVLPFVYNDVYYHKLFPHRALPHCIWLDRRGRVLAITESNMVTRGNIQKVLAIIDGEEEAR